MWLGPDSRASTHGDSNSAAYVDAKAKSDAHPAADGDTQSYPAACSGPRIVHTAGGYCSD